MSNPTRASGTTSEMPPVLGSILPSGIVLPMTPSLGEVVVPAVVGHSLVPVVVPVVVPVGVVAVVVSPAVVVASEVVVPVVPSNSVRTRVPSDMGGAVVASGVVVSVGVPVGPVVESVVSPAVVGQGFEAVLSPVVVSPAVDVGAVVVALVVVALVVVALVVSADVAPVVPLTPDVAPVVTP